MLVLLGLEGPEELLGLEVAEEEVRGVSQMEAVAMVQMVPSESLVGR